ncbi:MAG TPA: FtsX-like permease family protein [Candidatus Binatia bacterium]|nr:FtsX-like permease family protein [Candidatus Binatia bacterium]
MKTWVWRLALRDGRSGLRPLLLSMSSVILAVASVVAAFSFRDNLQSSIRTQSKSLLGADLALDSREPFTPEDEALFLSIGGDQSRQIGFSSMIYFSRTGDSRLVQVRAISGNFPYYGALEAEPAFSSANFHRDANALVDENVMLQFNARVGDLIKIGEHEFRISNQLRKIPGETLAFSLISPRVYIPLAYLDQTGLVQKGSLVRYRAFFKLPENTDVDALVKKLQPDLERLRLQADTVSRRARSIAASTENLARYLTLAVFVAVLLAGVGVASVVHVFARVKARSVALLRCIGAGPDDTVCVYVIQILLLAFVSSIIGAALGIGAQYALPLALKDFIPVTTVIRVAPAGIIAGFIVGLGTALLFALIPLLPLRRISPLLALRASFDAEHPRPDRLVLLMFALVAAGIWAFAAWTTGSNLSGSWFTAGVLAVFGVLFALARGASALLRKTAPVFLSFPWRQGLANLHRPNNQTAAVMLAIGLGTFLLVTLYSAQRMLVSQVAGRAATGEPNLVLFDVQRDQRAGITELIVSQGISMREEVPIVTMRLTRVKGTSVDELRAERKIPFWALRREYRSTYRSGLSQTEEIIAGAWQGKIAPDADPIPVSLEKGIADTLRVGLGDELVFEIQGVPLRIRIASLRKVDWQRVQPNFFVVFPEGVLEEAPQFWAVVAWAQSNQAAANLQRRVVERFPNVSAIDLSLILNTLNSILSKVSAAMRFIALFTIVTGFAVLASAVLGSRAQRLRESILLRTLGAPRAQILTVVAAEYLLLGAVAGMAGSILGVGASWALSFYFFGTPGAIAVGPVLVILAAVMVATVIAGAAGCWGIFQRSPLEALRAEA